jgi:hypothetical protein
MSVLSAEREMTSHSITPLDAVADAMLSAQYYLISLYQQRLKSQKETDLLNYPIEKKLMFATDGRCEGGSTYSLFYLFSKYPSLFKYMFLIHGQFSPEDGLYFKQNKIWAYHKFFMVYGIDLTWYAGSPANYNPDAKDDDLSTVLQAPNLPEIISLIESKCGGMWPKSDQISSGLEKKYSHPKIIPYIPERKVVYFSVNDISPANEGYFNPQYAIWSEFADIND